LSGFHLPSGSVALGSVKSNFGHLKGAAGAAGVLKAALALRDKVLPPSLHCKHPNPNIDFAHSPLYVNTELKPWTAPADGVLRAPERLVIDYADATDLADKSAKALKGLAANQAPVWKALRAQGISRGHGPAPKVAFLYTGQGSQYVNMLRPLCAVEPIVARTFAEADGVMTPLLGKPLSEFIFVDSADAQAVAKAEQDLLQTAITQPAVLAADLALTRLLAAYGVQPDMTMGHSLGEYGALVAVGAIPFADALEAVSARGRLMTVLSMEDNGRMAAVFAPLDEIERILKTVTGYVVI